MKRILLLPILLVALLLGPGETLGVGVIQVPGDYPDIYTAVMLAPPGSIIKVSGEHWVEKPIEISKDLTIQGGRFVPIKGYEVVYDPIFIVSKARVRLVGVEIFAERVEDPYKLVGIELRGGRLEAIQSNITMPLTDVLFLDRGKRFSSSIFANTGVFVRGGAAGIYSSYIKSEIGVMIGDLVVPPQDPIKLLPLERRDGFGKGGDLPGRFRDLLPPQERPEEVSKENLVVAMSGLLDNWLYTGFSQPSFPSPSPLTLSNPIYVNSSGNMFVVDIAYYIYASSVSPVLDSRMNLVAAEQVVYAAFGPIAPFDLPITSLVIDVWRDRYYAWRGGGGISFEYSGVSAIAAASNMYVRFSDVLAEGQGIGHLVLTGGRIGRTQFGINFYFFLDGGEYRLADSPVFLGMVTRETSSPLVVYMNNLDVTSEGGDKNPNVFTWIYHGRGSNGLDMYIRNVFEEGFYEGIRVDTEDYIKTLRIFGYGYIHWERSGPGLSLNVLLANPSNPLGYDPKKFIENMVRWTRSGVDELVGMLAEKDDVVFLYSILWPLNLNAPRERDGIGVSLIETVYVQGRETILRNAWINSIWTLETRVVSQYTDTPIPGAYVEYSHAGLLEASGLTGPAGSFTSTFIHRIDSSSYNPLDVFSVQRSFISPLRVDARVQGASAGTLYIPYVGDEITLPNWFGRIVLRLPILAVRALGFSHDMGTTYLEILGYRGGFAGFYSYTPDEQMMRHHEGKDNMTEKASKQWIPGGEGYNYYDLRILRIAYSPTYIRIEAMILYEGYWQPTVIYINTIERLVWSPGPVDFRGWY